MSSHLLAASATAAILTLPCFAQDDFETKWLGFEASAYERPWVGDVADLDCDGDPDLVISNFWFYARIGVSLNQGDGTFGPPAHYAHGQDAYDGSLGVLAADFNGDGFPDVAVSNTGANWDGDTVSVLLNQGDATFGPFQEYVVGSGSFVGPLGLAAADFDQDGSLDLAVAKYGLVGDGDSVAILYGDGSGGFGPVASITVGSAPYRLAVADLRLDGLPDLVVAREGPPAAVSVLLNTETGFSPAVSYPGGGGFINHHPCVAIADVDQDDDVDVIYSGERLDLLRNQGDGTLAPAEGLGATPGALAAGDVTGDGLPDLLGTYGSGDWWSLRVNDGAGGFLPLQPFFSGEQPMDVELADADGDGDLDPIVIARFSHEAAVFTNPGDGDFSPPPQHQVSGLPSPYELAAAGDVDGDGDLDLVGALPGSLGGGGVAVLANDGDGSFSPAEYYLTTQGGNAPKLRDLDGDGDLDIVWADDSPPYNFKTCMNSGDGTFGAITTWPANTCGNTGLDAFDLDGDDDIDVVLLEGLGCGVEGDKRLYISLNQGAGTFQLSSIVVTTTHVRDVTAGHFDGDGALDMVAVGSQVAIHLGNGDGSFQPFLSYTPSGNRVTTDDLNGDGILDLATSRGEFVHVYLGNGDGTFGPATTYGVSPAMQGGARQVAIGDTDGDGYGEILVANGGSHDVSLLRNNGDGTFQPQLRYGASRNPVDLVSGDFTGDGRLDLAVLGQGAGVTTAYSIVPGKAPAAIPGDLDGDGTVGISDLLALLAIWGPCPNCPPSCAADLDGDCAVGIADLLMLLANWS